MNKIRFGFAILLVMGILFGFAGCGSDENSGECKSNEEMFNGVCVNKLWPKYKKLEAVFKDPKTSIEISEHTFEAGTQNITFHINTSIVSFAAALYTDPIYLINVSQIEDPNGNTYNEHPAIKYFSPSPMPIINGPYCKSCVLPVAGDWKVLASFDGYGENKPIQVMVAQKSVEQSPLEYGTLDINFIFVGLPEINSEILESTDLEHQVIRRNINTMIVRIKNIFAQAGIKIGNIRFFDAPEDRAEQFAVLDTQRSGPVGLSEYDLLMIESKDWLPDDDEVWRAINVFCVQEITNGGDVGGIRSMILGLASGIPSMVSPKGLPVGGLAVAMGGFTYIEEQMGKVVAHEIGHLLGLFHPTEATGKIFDPLDDTPECDADQYDTNHDNYVDPKECEEKGGDNLMFWFINLDNYLGTITDEQRYVMLHSLWVH